jgi:hypothetical protein
MTIVDREYPLKEFARDLPRMVDILPNGCWIWNGSYVNQGRQYPTPIYRKGSKVNKNGHREPKIFLVKRMVLMFKTGVYRFGNVESTCALAQCVNPDHLTYERQSRKHRLTPEQINFIRASDLPTPILAEMLGVPYITMYDFRVRTKLYQPAMDEPSTPYTPGRKALNKTLAQQPYKPLDIVWSSKSRKTGT